LTACVRVLLERLADRDATGECVGDGRKDRTVAALAKLGMFGAPARVHFHWDRVEDAWTDLVDVTRPPDGGFPA